MFACFTGSLLPSTTSDLFKPPFWRTTRLWTRAPYFIDNFLDMKPNDQNFKISRQNDLCMLHFIPIHVRHNWIRVTNHNCILVLLITDV